MDGDACAHRAAAVVVVRAAGGARRRVLRIRRVGAVRMRTSVRTSVRASVRIGGWHAGRMHACRVRLVLLRHVLRLAIPPIGMLRLVGKVLLLVLLL